MNNSACAAQFEETELQAKIIVNDEKGKTIAKFIACAHTITQWFIKGLLASVGTQ